MDRTLIYAGLGLAALTGVVGMSSPVQRLDLLMLDTAMSLMRAPAPSDIVIVAVDDASLDAFGRWPWPRAMHAELLQRIAMGKPKAVGLQLILSEPDNGDPISDDALASAMTTQRPVVLPVFVDDVLGAGTPREVLPVPVLAEVATLGHSEITLDPDGLLRRVALWAGFPGTQRPHFALAMLHGGGEAKHYVQPATAATTARRWVRADERIVPFLGPPGHFRTLSYADVLADRTPAEAFRDSYVIIGVTAAGLTDMLPTPVSAGYSPLAGVEFTANVLAALRAGRLVDDAPEAWQYSAGAVWVLLTLLLRILARRFRSFVLFATPVVPLLLSAALLHAGIWLAPIAAVLGSIAFGIVSLVIDRRAAEREAAARALADEQRLRALETELEQATRLGMVGEVSAAIAHELNQPLTALRTYAAACRRLYRPGGVATDEGLGSLLEKIAGQAERAATIIVRMRELYEHGRQSELVVQDLDTAVEEAVGLAMLSKPDTAIDLRLKLDRSLPLIGFDRLQIQQVVVNLVRNAVDAVRGRPQRTILVRTGRRPGGRIAVTVTDNGPGVPAEIRGELFQPFVSGRPGGMGMGLHISRRIADSHQGDLILEDSDARSTSFTLLLPSPEAQPAPVATRSPPPTRRQPLDAIAGAAQA